MKKIKIKRIDKNLPLPKYETKGAAAFDLFCREETIISPRETALLPLNVIIETPPGYMLVIVPRSSTPRKKGLSIPHGIGVIDQDYRGPKDEIKLQVFNFTNQEVKVEKGERLGQGVFVRIDKFEWEETEEITNQTRGGFGSTDK